LVFRSWRFLAYTATAAVVIASCTGSSPTVPAAAPSASATSAGAGRSAASSPGPSPSPGAAACRHGQGTLDTSCARGVPAFLPEVESAIDQLAREQPEVFNLADQAGPGGYKVLDTERYYAGVMSILESRDFCAGFDLVELQLKNGSQFSEQYDILLATGHARRGAATYQATCTPPSFPLDAADLIDAVRVGFFGFRCDEGLTPPRNGENKLPLGCAGYVTATPKNAANGDVDPRVHGDRIDWRLEQDEEYVRVEEFPDIPFNKKMVPVKPGRFSLCATVKGVEGCLHAEVPR
jgi:hypothetical protein